jgi:hypothetical protein
MKSASQYSNQFPVVFPEQICKLSFDKRDAEQVVAVVAGVDGLPAQPVLGYEAQNDITSQREMQNRKLLVEFANFMEQAGIPIVCKANKIQRWKKKVRQDTKRREQRRKDMAKWSPLRDLKNRLKELKQEFEKYKELHTQTAQFYMEEMKEIVRQIKQIKK